MNRKARLDRLQRDLLREFDGEAELDAAIEAELVRLGPEQAERFLREYSTEESLFR
jgi:hypothetical protein